MLALTEKQSLQYFSFTLSNFLAAIGGGLLLGKGINAIVIPYLQGGSILAFLVGTCLGLVFLQIIPKKYASSIARSFSFFGAMTSLVLLLIYNKYSINGKLFNSIGLIFFIFLSVRFGFWFFSRVLRAAAASGYQQNIAWVELGYYFGMIFGLITWNMLGIQISLGEALIIDAIAQFCAGITDQLSYRMIDHSSKQNNDNNAIQQINENSAYDSSWGWRLASVVVMLTIGIQVGTFHIAHQLHEEISLNILACFYLGVSIAAFICKYCQIQLTWEANCATLNFLFRKKVYKFNYVFICAAAISTMLLTFCVANHFFINTYPIFLLLSLIIVSAFLYEILILIVLDRIGFEEKSANKNGMVIRTYGGMAIGAAISLWALGMLQSNLSIPAMLGLCLLGTSAAIKTRDTE